MEVEPEILGPAAVDLNRIMDIIQALASFVAMF